MNGLSEFKDKLLMYTTSNGIYKSFKSERKSLINASVISSSLLSFFVSVYATDSHSILWIRKENTVGQIRFHCRLCLSVSLITKLVLNQQPPWRNQTLGNVSATV